MGWSYATIKIMKAELPKPVHGSYRRHRSQLTGQIILPVVLAVLLCLALVVVLINVTLIQNGGDINRWAAISTIWIVIPVILAGVIFLLVLLGVIYLLARLLGVAPVYTIKAQDLVQMLGTRIRRAADRPVRPIIFLDSIGASIKTLLGRK